MNKIYLLFLVEEKTPEKKTPKSIGGVGFGGLLTQDALSVIKLRKSNSNTKLPPKKEKPENDSSELSKKVLYKSLYVPVLP